MFHALLNFTEKTINMINNTSKGVKIKNVHPKIYVELHEAAQQTVDTR
jgi:uncharacterized Zn-finger protein